MNPCTATRPRSTGESLDRGPDAVPAAGAKPPGPVAANRRDTGEATDTMRARGLPNTAALAAFVVLILSSPAAAQASGEDSVTGFQQVPFAAGGADMQVDARSGPAGQNPTGTFAASFSFGWGEQQLVVPRRHGDVPGRRGR
jgi:hypothetical protein